VSAAEDPRESGDPNLWALDLAPFPYAGCPEQPVAAHLIVYCRKERYRGEVRVAACGKQFTAGTHPRGWWGTRWGNLPLQDHAVHCGHGLIREQSGRCPDPDCDGEPGHDPPHYQWVPG